MIRRVVTGHRAGKAVVVDDGAPARTHSFQSMPGREVSVVWATSRQPTVGGGTDGEDTTRQVTFLPREAESRLVLMKIPPRSATSRADFDAAAAAREFVEVLPEMAATRERDDPAMHRTDTIDYVLVLDGEIHLELDDGREVVLKQHDIVVQSGTRHAWRNKGENVVTMAVVLIGARRL